EAVPLGAAVLLGCGVEADGDTCAVYGASRRLSWPDPLVLSRVAAGRHRPPFGVGARRRLHEPVRPDEVLHIVAAGPGCEAELCAAQHLLAAAFGPPFGGVTPCPGGADGSRQPAMDGVPYLAGDVHARP